MSLQQTDRCRLRDTVVEARDDLAVYLVQVKHVVCWWLCVIFLACSRVFRHKFEDLQWAVVKQADQNSSLFDVCSILTCHLLLFCLDLLFAFFLLLAFLELGSQICTIYWVLKSTYLHCSLIYEHDALTREQCYNWVQCKGCDSLELM